MQYIRTHFPGGCYFFTVLTQNREPIFNIDKNVSLLRNSFRYVIQRHPFIIDAFVLLPDHLHCIFTLPENDYNYSMRWNLIIGHFSRHIVSLDSNVSPSKIHKRERNIWQRRFWEHHIVDEQDFQYHIEYIHFNPVKHGYVTTASDWPYSSFHKFVKMKIYESDWGMSSVENKYIGRE
jgi:putative transposase